MAYGYEKLKKAVDYIRTVTDFVPNVAIVLGSGLGDFAKNIEKTAEIPYKDIPGFPVSTVTGHEGKFIFGKLNRVNVVVMQGRVHYYEGYDMADVVMPTRIMHLLGAQKLILTCAAGAINKEYRQGEFMVLSDHISMLVPSPNRGTNIDELGPRFFDMAHTYSEEYRKYAHEIADKKGIVLHEGVYIQTPGPQFETPAEIRAYSMWGADAVGMSTTCEAIAANQMGMKICAISCLTNMAAGIQTKPLTHEEVKETANKVAKHFEILITKLVERIA